MTKALTTTLIILIIALIGVFYNSIRTPELAQISDAIIEDDQSTLLPISPSKTPIAQTELQAAAYRSFLRFFGGELAQKDFGLIEPIAGFKQAITKKPFGIYITPETSPVEHDKFTGYHTGVDSEFSDSNEEIPVRAIADGTLVVSTWTTGYGGVVVVKHIIEGVPLFALYGHIDPASFLPAGTVEVKAGQQIGVLGDDHSEETDGARKHLHFSIYTGSKMDFRGYVQTEEELANWLNPLDLY